MMTNKDLFDLLSFEVANGLKTVEIIQDIKRRNAVYPVDEIFDRVYDR